jgi:hypothetical protein
MHEMIGKKTRKGRPAVAHSPRQKIGHLFTFTRPAIGSAVDKVTANGGARDRFSRDVLDRIRAAATWCGLFQPHRPALEV